MIVLYVSSLRIRRKIGSVPPSTYRVHSYCKTYVYDAPRYIIYIWQKISIQLQRPKHILSQLEGMDLLDLERYNGRKLQSISCNGRQSLDEHSFEQLRGGETVRISRTKRLLANLLEHLLYYLQQLFVGFCVVRWFRPPCTVCMCRLLIVGGPRQLDPFTTAVPLGGQTTYYHLTGLSPKRDCRLPSKVNQPPRSPKT